MTQSETETPYLICHKVRGQPAFDIAIKLEGDIWIIPTSGHRAYPCWYYELDELYSAPDKGTLCIREMMGTDEVPETLPDHYSANDTKPKHMRELTLEDLEL